MLNYKIYLKDILDAIQRIEKSTKGLSKEQFKKKTDIWDATLMRIQIIGESIKKVPLNIKTRYKDVEWRKMSRVRDIISHAYFAVNPEIVWGIITNKLPKLKKEIKEILKKKK